MNFRPENKASEPDRNDQLPPGTADIENTILRIRAAGAGFIVLVCGDVMTMPDLPRHPAALDIGLGENEPVEGLV